MFYSFTNLFSVWYNIQWLSPYIYFGIQPLVIPYNMWPLSTYSQDDKNEEGRVP